MKKVFMLLFVSFICILPTNTVNAIHINPNMNWKSVYNIHEMYNDMSFYGGAIRMNNEDICLSDNLGEETYVYVYEANKLLNASIENHSIMNACSEGQSMTQTVSIAKTETDSETYERMIEESLTSEMSISGEIKSKVPFCEASAKFEDKISLNIGESITKSYTRENTTSYDYTISYTVTKPGFYMLQSRKFFKVYLFEYYSVLYNFERGKRIGIYGKYLTKSFIKLVPVDKIESIAYVKYNPNKNGTFTVDNTVMPNNNVVVYI